VNFSERETNSHKIYHSNTTKLLNSCLDVYGPSKEATVANAINMEDVGTSPDDGSSAPSS